MQVRRNRLLVAAAVAACVLMSAVMLVRAYETNQAARVVVGQDFFNQQSANNASGTPKANSLQVGYGVYCDGTRLYIADSLNNRVLIFNTIPTTNFENADIFIGQADGASNSINQGGGVAGSAGNTLYQPWGVFATDSTLFVADTRNHRVLIYNDLSSIATNEFADVVVGHLDMTTEALNDPAVPEDANLNWPRSVWSDGTNLFIADSSNYRVLVFNPIPTTNGESAVASIGQTSTTNKTNYGAAVTGETLDQPYYVSADANHLFVGDTGNHRVMIYDPPYVTQSTASIIIGQPSDTSEVTQGCLPTGLSSPRGVYSDGTRLYIADSGQHRILVYNALPTTQQEADAGANFAIGQTSTSTCLGANKGGGVNADTLSLPSVAVSNSSDLYIMDSSNRRVLIYSPEPANQGDADIGADIVVGQPTMVSNAANAGVVAADVFNFPYSAHSDGTKLYVADRSNNRVLIWNTVPTTNGVSADVIVGQNADSAITANRGGAVASNTLSAPTGVFATGTALYIADSSNNRVLIYTTVPANQAAAEVGADLVVGQINGGASGAGTTASTLSAPYSVFVESNGAGKMYISDYNNNRVLIFNSVPVVNGVSADAVVGQTLLTNGGINGGAGVGNSGANTLYQPTGVYSNSASQLYVADKGNNRVLIYNFPVATNELADIVLGQPDMITETVNTGGLSAQSLSSPYDVSVDASALYVSDYNNNRVLIWDPVPTADFASASKVIGQPTLVVNTADNGGISARSLDKPISARVQGTKLFIADSNNHRVLIYYPYQESGQVIYVR